MDPENNNVQNVFFGGTEQSRPSTQHICDGLCSNQECVVYHKKQETNSVVHHDALISPSLSLPQTLVGAGTGTGKRVEA